MKLHFQITDVVPRTENQLNYLQTIEDSDITFASGPAGSGKTFLAVAYSINQVLSSYFNKVVLIRPAVEAGEELGSLPGEIDARMDPYMQPYYDSLSKLLPTEQVRDWRQKRIIEISPIAYLRGRTFNKSIMIVDEAQNCSPTQMKMILTRLGKRSKMIVTGDPVQSDRSGENGFVDAMKRLQGIQGLSFVMLENEDIQRHKIIGAILERYS